MKIGTTDSKAKKNDFNIQRLKFSKRTKYILITLGVLAVIAILILVYGYFAIYYQTHFFKNTYINNVNCSGMDVATVARNMDSQANTYMVELVGRDKEGKEITLATLQAEEIGYEFVDTLGAANDILEQQDERLWILMRNKVNYYNISQGVAYDKEVLAEKVKSLDCFQTKNMTAPADAYIGEYSEEIKGYEIVEETLGNTIDLEKAVAAIELAIIGNSDKEQITVNLVEEGCYQEPKLRANDSKMKSAVTTINKWLGTEITYDWNGNRVVVDTDVIKGWVALEDGKPVLDEEAVAAFVNKNADDFDTSSKNALFTTTLGVQISLPRLSYGWKTDRESETKELLQLIKSGSKENREPVYFRKGVWKGSNDIGNSYVEADLTRQHLYVYQNGTLVLETDFVSGDPNKPDCVSPTGIFGITYKTTNAVLRGADYETPVVYWMPFYGNFGMHDATWRDSFGGEIYLTDGSHGCLNLPLDAAAQIYNYVYTGSPVICYN